MEGGSRRRFLARVGTGLSAATLASGCLSRRTGPSPALDQRISVGSKHFTENRILGFLTFEAVNQVLGVQPVHEIGYGRTSTIWSALVEGAVDTYWEYTGTLWYVHLPPDVTQERIADPLKLFQRVRTGLRETYDLECFSPAPFDNPYVLCTRPEWVDETGITTHSGLFEYAAAGNSVPIAVGPEFYHRTDGWPGLLDHYEVDADTRAAWAPNVEVVNLFLAYEFLLRERIDVGMGFGTDPHIAINDLVVLEDDRDFFPPYNPCPVVRTEVLDRIDGLGPLLDQLGPLIQSAEQMRELNARVVVDGEQPQQVALSVLREGGIVP